MAMSIKKKLNVCDDRRKSLRSSLRSQGFCDHSLNSSEDKKPVQQQQLQINNQQLLKSYKIGNQTPEDCEHALDNNNLHAQQTKVSDKDSPIKKIQSDQCSHQKQISSQNQEENNQISIQVCIREKHSVQNNQQNYNASNSKNAFRSKKSLQFSPYVEQRTSYRKKNRRKLDSIPYRKCQDQFQQRIVTIINKIQHKKNYQKDLQNLGDKIQKISNKDIFNKYVVSGLETIINLMKKTDLQKVQIQSRQTNCLRKLQKQQQNLKRKIIDELERTDEYEKAEFDQNTLDISEARPKMMRKIYKLLKKKNEMTPEEAREITIHQFSQFFKETQNNLLNDNLLRFLKNFNNS